LADVAVRLNNQDSTYSRLAQTDARGQYQFARVPKSAYNLIASKQGYIEAQASVGLDSGNKTLDLTLQAVSPAQGTSASGPQFFDQPQFAISGVTDTTNVAGHGSDTVVRAREGLAKETAALGATAANPSVDASREQSLREDAKRIRESLATNDSADLHHRLGDIEEKLGDSLEAVRQYQRAAELDPTEPHLFDWGAELLLHHAPEPASEVFSRGTKLFPRSVRMLLGVGASFFARGSIDDAIHSICQASDLNPGDPAPYLFLGKMELNGAAVSDDLAQRLHRFLLVLPNADSNFYYAVALWKRRSDPREKNAVQRAESLLQNAVRIDPKHAPARLQLGILHSEQDSYAEAISDFQKAIEADPQLEEAHYRLAQVYRLTGKPEKAAEELRVYDDLTKASAARHDRESHEIKQFVYTLRDPAPPLPH